MRIRYCTFVFRVELCSYEPRVIRDLNYFNQSCFRIFTSGKHSALFKFFEVFIVEFITRLPARFAHVSFKFPASSYAFAKCRVSVSARIENRQYELRIMDRGEEAEGNYNRTIILLLMCAYREL